MVDVCQRPLAHRRSHRTHRPSQTWTELDWDVVDLHRLLLARHGTRDRSHPPIRGTSNWRNGISGSRTSLRDSTQSHFFAVWFHGTENDSFLVCMFPVARTRTVSAAWPVTEALFVDSKKCVSETVCVVHVYYIVCLVNSL